jgi:hypothetical protein
MQLPVWKLVFAEDMKIEELYDRSEKLFIEVCRWIAAA